MQTEKKGVFKKLTGPVSGRFSIACRCLPGRENLFVLQLLHSGGGSHRHGDHDVVDVKGALATPPLDGLLLSDEQREDSIWRVYSKPTHLHIGPMKSSLRCCLLQARFHVLSWISHLSMYISGKLQDWDATN